MSEWGANNWGTFAWASDTTATWSYFVLDHLGSVAVITDANGTVSKRLSYDAWGKQRNPNGTDATCGSITSPTTRGFTNEEQMPVACLVNLNARIYDPTLGKFMSPDSIIPDPFGSQSFNRYSYVINNPLSFTDPTGHDGFWDWVSGLFNNGNEEEEGYGGGGQTDPTAQQFIGDAPPETVIVTGDAAPQPAPPADSVQYTSISNNPGLNTPDYSGGGGGSGASAIPPTVQQAAAPAASDNSTNLTPPAQTAANSPTVAPASNVANNSQAVDDSTAQGSQAAQAASSAPVAPPPPAALAPAAQIPQGSVNEAGTNGANENGGCPPGTECVTVTGNQMPNPGVVADPVDLGSGLTQIATNITIEPFSNDNQRHQQCILGAHNCYQTYPNNMKAYCNEGEAMCNSFYDTRKPGTVDLSISPAGTKSVIWPDGSVTIIPPGQKNVPTPPNAQ